MIAFLLNPGRFRWLDRIPAPRMPRWRKRGQRHADALTPPKVPAPGWTGPKHASSERIACGGLSRGTLPRRAPGETRLHLIDRGPGKPPFLTGAQAVLAGECLPTIPQMRAEYFALPVYGEASQLEVAAEAERLAGSVIA